MPSHSGLFTVIERAARKAAPRLRRDFNEVQNLQVSRKGPADFVSQADQRAEQTLYEELSKARPDWGFVMEERGNVEGDPSKPRFIVDPLDGTSNFLHGIPHFCISIAVEEPMPNGKREITTALVYQPLTDESFWAEKGRGAWLQDQRLRVSSRREPSEALIATGIPFMGHGDFAQWTRIFGAVAPQVAGIRRLGAAALDLAWVAAGRFDGFWESDLKIWDVAAGMLLVKEAGGFVTDFRGGDRAIERNEFLAANDAMHSKLHKMVAQALR
ncbi:MULTISPECIES: inositol monophosphatase family protein [Sphingomonas]|jgi:myo-inositol-1(or 4)-monophosphatase|uniref:Inositol-1-monophosphatase n=1 Tax=Sphingomonas ginsenosidimutans TaxID=862134 RepID=A0A2A4I436_9SPHN|nr:MULTISPECIES: inositol monophosphatase family protein [Sphingomonas]MBY0301603.1 inositol monophosphatase [Sphingomonas ginsenosidimutans]MEE2915701.1 inositol monophosphatase family protein [Pseudomonadota bacterium]PCG10667.1 inositol monophosphatase [Sphingomonas ginsenosidimutans]